MTTSVLSKIVDDILICGPEKLVDMIIDKIKSRFTLGTITQGARLLRYFGLNIIQHENYSVFIDANNKINAIAAYQMRRTKRREHDSRLSTIKVQTFVSINGSIALLGITSSPFCAILSSMFQRIATTATGLDLCRQTSRLKELQKMGTHPLYDRPTDKTSYPLEMLVFSNTGSLGDSEQLCHIAGPLIGPMQSDSVYHVETWSSHKAKRPVKLIDIAKILATGDAIDVEKILAQAYQAKLDILISLIIGFDSKDLYSSLSTQLQSMI